MNAWTPNLTTSTKPRYLAIADAIARDIETGNLSPGDRLPAQRFLAARLDVDFTTVARGYVEAQKRGLIASTVGRGTFVAARAAAPAKATAPPTSRRIPTGRAAPCRPFHEPAAGTR